MRTEFSIINRAGGEEMTENEIDVTKKVSEFKEAFSEFKKNFSELMKGLQVDVNDWGFSLESHKNEIIVDMSVKLVIKHGKKE
jgi:hypothetical protein